jgi:L-ascorbate metabolism protein UlaG (beta-lactamase superfamily)
VATNSITVTYIGGPTALIEMNGVRLLTDPTFDSAGTSYPTAAYTLEKSLSPGIGADQLGRIDAVLLSHDHHFDNLDHAGRALLSRAERVFTTIAGAERLGPPAVGLAPWQEATIPTPDGTRLRLTATPARHGPEGGDRGPVIGFVVTPGAERTGGVYVTGDTVWFEGVNEVSRRFSSVTAALLFLGAAFVAVAGPAPLTLTAEDGVKVARAFPDAALVPVHFEGWAHFTQGRAEVERAFEAAGLADRLRWLAPGESTAIA